MKIGQTFEMKLSRTRSWLLLAIAVTSGLTLVAPHAFAGSLTKTALLELGGASNANPMIASTAQSFAVDFKTSGSGATTASIDFTVGNFLANTGTVNGTQTISSTGCATYFPGATPLPGSLNATVTSNVINITGISPSLSATTEYCVVLTSTSAITNPSAGVYSALITAGSDSQTAAFDVLGSGANAYTITGTVAPTFTMSLSGASDAIATLSATSLTVSTGISVTVNTNAGSGWSLYAKDSNAGLHSTSASHTIPSVATGSNQTMNGGTIGTEAYALGVSANATTNYAYNGGTTGGGLSSSAFNQIATSATVANNVSQTLHELVDIASTTAAATDYTDTITVIGAGQF